MKRPPAIDRTTARLALKFARLLRDEIGQRNMREVIARNERAEYGGSCASHDYCDANVLMDAAMQSTIGHGFTGADIPLINAAWEFARRHCFGHAVGAAMMRTVRARERKRMEGFERQQRAVRIALEMMREEGELSPSSALKEAGRICGIPWGNEMEALFRHAETSQEWR